MYVISDMVDAASEGTKECKKWINHAKTLQKK
jgi:hypothetical protein